jgi:hypothetical protein
MTIIRLVLCMLAISIFGACTSITEVTETVYPTKLHVPTGEHVISAGNGYGLGALAVILGKTEFDASDSIKVVVRDLEVLQVVGSWKGQYRCDENGFDAVCVTRGIDVKGLKVGFSYIIFQIADKADSVKMVVHPQKG